MHKRFYDFIKAFYLRAIGNTVLEIVSIQHINTLLLWDLQQSAEQSP